MPPPSRAPIRALILGPTGTQKAVAMQQLERYRRELYGKAEFNAVHFERDFLIGKNGSHSFDQYLDLEEQRQRNYWLDGWARLKEAIDQPPLRDTSLLLNLHAVLARRTYGTRCPLFIAAVLEDFKPDIVITLIDDAYLMWWRTHQRAGDRAYYGKPTLEQLLQARREETLLGDVISGQLSSHSNQVPHYVVATWHPTRVLDRLIFRHDSLKRYYASFHISALRRVYINSGRKDLSLMHELDAYLQRIAQAEEQDQSLLAFCPLTIDEYPLLLLLEPEVKKTIQRRGAKSVPVDCRTFKLKNRWDIRNFYGRAAHFLCGEEPSLPEDLDIPVEEIENAKGQICADVPIRDYRLIAQANAGLVVINPIVNGEMSGGVFNEIIQAISHQKSVHIWQDPQHDGNAELGKVFGQESPAMGGSPPGYDRIVVYPTFDRLLEQLHPASPH